MKLFFFKYATRKNTQNPMHRYSRMKFDCIFIGRQIENCAIKTGYIYCTVYSNSFMQKQTEKRNHQKLFQFFFLLWLDKITWHKRWKHMEQMNAFTLVQWDADRNRRRTKGENRTILFFYLQDIIWWNRRREEQRFTIYSKKKKLNEKMRQKNQPTSKHTSQLYIYFMVGDWKKNSLNSS